MNITRYRPAVAVLLVILGARISSAAIVNAKFDSKQDIIHKICLLPVETELTKVGMKGGESMLKESEAWATKLAPTVAEAFTVSGAEIVGQFTPEQLESSEDLRQTVLKLQQKYSGISAQMEKKPKDIRKGRYSLGDEVALLPCTVGADSLVFVHGKGVIPTEGRKVFGLLTVGVPSLFWTNANVEVTLVDGRTGVVTARAQIYSFRTKSTEDPTRAFAKGLQKELIKMHVGQAKAD